jgi:hypothetical protein
MQLTMFICIFSNSSSNPKRAFLDSVEWWIEASWIQIVLRYQSSQSLQVEDSNGYPYFINPVFENPCCSDSQDHVKKKGLIPIVVISTVHVTSGHSCTGISSLIPIWCMDMSTFFCVILSFWWFHFPPMESNCLSSLFEPREYFTVPPLWTIGLRNSRHV